MDCMGLQMLTTKYVQKAELLGTAHITSSLDTYQIEKNQFHTRSGDCISVIIIIITIMSDKCTVKTVWKPISVYCLVLFEPNLRHKYNLDL